MAGVLLRRAAGAARALPSSWRSNVSLLLHRHLCVLTDQSFDVKVAFVDILGSLPRQQPTAAAVGPPFYPGQMFILHFGHAGAGCNSVDCIVCRLCVFLDACCWARVRERSNRPPDR